MFQYIDRLLDDACEALIKQRLAAASPNGGGGGGYVAASHSDGAGSSDTDSEDDAGGWGGGGVARSFRRASSMPSGAPQHASSGVTQLPAPSAAVPRSSAKLEPNGVRTPGLEAASTSATEPRTTAQ